MFHVEHCLKKYVVESIVEGNLVDVIARKIYPGRIIFKGERIVSVEKINKTIDGYILPGLVDAHVHVESSMLTPQEFARLAIRNGTTQCVSDPHEIANVLGVEGVRFMIEDAARSPIRITFGAPSCVPATSFETSGAIINSKSVGELLDWEGIGYLSEMMNFPGVFSKDAEVMAKIFEAQKRNMKIDGHAPGITGSDLDLYIGSGISTDHECSSLKEAKEKIGKGMKILIREGSAAKNLEALYALVDTYPEMVMFCTDDIHPDDLEAGHMNNILSNAVRKGCDFFNAVRAMTINPMMHYGLEQALLQAGDLADFIVVNKLEEMVVRETYIGGTKVYCSNKGVKKSAACIEKPNLFKARNLIETDISVPVLGENIRVIVAEDGELVTGQEIIKVNIEDGLVNSNVDQDVLKIVVLNRYEIAKPAIGFIKGFGLRSGALASSIAHDSHNIICVGVDDIAIVEAINFINQNKGGVVVHTGSTIKGIPLPVAGIMTDESGEVVARAYKELNRIARELGSELTAPFMTLSFMALLVIPELKLGDKGLFNINAFRQTSLFI